MGTSSVWRFELADADRGTTRSIVVALGANIVVALGANIVVALGANIAVALGANIVTAIAKLALHWDLGLAAGGRIL